MSVLEQALASSVSLSDFIGQNLGERADGVSAQHIVAIALYSIALEHREATLLLVSQGAYTSSRTVARSSLEAYVSACWFDAVATEQQAREFMRAKRPPPSFERAAQQLRHSHALGEVFEKLRAHYKTLSDYAHGHARQASRWIGGDGSIEPRHEPAEMVEVLHFVDTIGVLACLGRESLAKRPVEPFAAMFDKVLRRSY